VQQRKGFIKYNGSTAPPLGVSWPAFIPDATRTSAHPATVFDLSNRFLYSEDPPGVRGFPATLGANGDELEWDLDFRIWVEFRFPSGSWTRVSNVVDWGMTLRMEKVAGDWTITQPGAAK